MKLKDQNTWNNYRTILIKEQTAGKQNAEQNETAGTDPQNLEWNKQNWEIKKNNKTTITTK